MGLALSLREIKIDLRRLVLERYRKGARVAPRHTRLTLADRRRILAQNEGSRRASVQTGSSEYPGGDDRGRAKLRRKCLALNYLQVDSSRRYWRIARRLLSLQHLLREVH